MHTASVCYMYGLGQACPNCSSQAKCCPWHSVTLSMETFSCWFLW